MNVNSIVKNVDVLEPVDVEVNNTDVTAAIELAATQSNANWFNLNQHLQPSQVTIADNGDQSIIHQETIIADLNLLVTAANTNNTNILNLTSAAAQFGDIALGMIDDKTGHQIGLQMNRVDAERIFMDDLDTYANNLTVPIVATAVAIATTDVSNSQVLIQYYSQTTSSTLSQVVMTLNGDVPVNIPGTYFRPFRMTLMPGTENDNAARIFIGPQSATWTAGIPDTSYDFMPAYLNDHYSPFIYVPPSHSLVFDNIIINGDFNMNGDIIAVCVNIHSDPDISKIHYKRINYVSHSLFSTSHYYAPVPGPATFHLTAWKVGGTGVHNLRMIFNTYLQTTDSL